MTTDSEREVPSMDQAIVSIANDIKKSASDPWNYRGLELANGMRVVLISHPDIDKAAAALDVQAGSFDDPAEVSGTAHFLEHMLFQGSSKYPGEDEYFRLIEGNGGYSNAYTSDDHTNFYFDINPSVFPSALDVFAQFFISPLLAASSVDREIQAVNSEHEAYLFQDVWRISQLEKSTSDPQHPYSRYNTGTTESLKTIPQQRGIDVRQVLCDFYQAQYSSNRMSLAVLSNQSLDELQALAVKSFKDVPNRNLAKTVYPPDPYGEAHRKTICYCTPAGVRCHLTVKWVIPDYRIFSDWEASSYMGHLVGHESDGSLLAYLRKLNLATALMAGSSYPTSGFNFFTIDIDLTLEAVDQWEKVVYIIYQYLALLRQEGPKQWVFDECKSLRETNFQYQEKARIYDTVSALSSRMRDYPLTDCLVGPYEMRELRPDLIYELLNEYLIPTKMRVILCAENLESITTEKEKNFGTSYKLETLSDELIQKCQTCELTPELHLPIPNEFIPTDFQLFSTPESTARPQLPTKIKENEFYRLFYTGDTFYKLPKAYLYFDFRCSLAFLNPFYCNIMALYVGLVEDSLKEYVYCANLADLSYSLTDTACGIQLTVQGYNHKIKQLLDKIIEQMINLEVQTKKLDTIKANMRGGYASFHSDVPSQMGRSGVSHLMDEHQWNSDEYLACLEDITTNDVVTFMTRMFSRFYIDSLMYGNLTKDQALEYMASVEKQFQDNKFYAQLLPAMWFNNRSLVLPEGCNYAYKMLNDVHKLQAIVVYLQCLDETLANSALVGLFCHLVHEPCFDQLRTKEQLGYDVGLYAFPLRDVEGLSITVQTPRELDYVDQRIELFLDSMRNYLSTMPDETFHQYREGYIVNRAEIEKEMQNQGNVFWNEISSHAYCFNRPQLEVELIRSLERADILRFYDYYVSPRSIHRRKLAVYVHPSPKAFQPQVNPKHKYKAKDVVEIWTGKALKIPPNTKVQNAMGLVAAIARKSHKVKKLTKQPRIIDVMSQRPLKEVETVVTENELNLPKLEWIDNEHVWKSKLRCYALTQPYEPIDVPVQFRL